MSKIKIIQDKAGMQFSSYVRNTFNFRCISYFKFQSSNFKCPAQRINNGPSVMTLYTISWSDTVAVTCQKNFSFDP